MGRLELRYAGPATFRGATLEDLAFLESMSTAAAAWSGPEGLRPSDSTLQRYLENWGRSGDVGIVAEVESVSVGAGWWRHFPQGRPGYGFINEEVPEITLAVSPAYRRRGIGRTLLAELIAAAERERIPALSLSVEADNPATQLYLAAGFEEVGESGGSLTMRRTVASDVG